MAKPFVCGPTVCLLCKAGDIELDPGHIFGNRQLAFEEEPHRLWDPAIL